MEKLNIQWIKAGEKLIRLSETTGAIKYGNFKLSSGKSSSYYFDGRLITLHPEGLQIVSSVFLPALRMLQADCVAGPTIGADPIIAGLVLTSGYSGNGINGLIVRKEAKGHGMSKVIEGELNALVVPLNDHLMEQLLSGIKQETLSLQVRQMLQ